MRYIRKFSSPKICLALSQKIKALMPLDRKVTFMEVCGTHTQSFYRHGLADFLPPRLRLIAGPGCPVCVSPSSFVEGAIRLCRQRGIRIVTFGDMLRVPGRESSLLEEKARGAKVHLMYSPLETIALASKYPQDKIVVLGVGFETTAPAFAVCMRRAKAQGLKNLYLYSSLKLIPPAMRALVKDGHHRIDGFLCPGHVSVIIGTEAYAFLARRFKSPCVIAGFEATDILSGILCLLQQVHSRTPTVINNYPRVVHRDGNPVARHIIGEVFSVVASSWRGLGEIPSSGLGLKSAWSDFAAEKEFPELSSIGEAAERKACRCAEVLRGLLYPRECRLFRVRCSPENPQGPCMVSSEGACNAVYRYGA